MHSIETLDIRGYRGEAVQNTLFRRRDATKHLSVILPGLGYTSHMPVLYYPALLLLAKGSDVLRAEYNYIRRSDFMALSADERRRWAADDATGVLTAGLNQRGYERVTLIGKSIGTAAMGHLITTGNPLPSLECIWLTPLLKNEQLLSQIRQVRHRALFVSGTADPHYDANNLAALEKVTGGASLVVEGADHSLEIEGDALLSLQALERMVQEIQRFLG